MVYSVLLFCKLWTLRLLFKHDLWQKNCWLKMMYFFETVCHLCNSSYVGIVSLFCDKTSDESNHNLKIIGWWCIIIGQFFYPWRPKAITVPYTHTLILCSQTLAPPGATWGSGHFDTRWEPNLQCSDQRLTKPPLLHRCLLQLQLQCVDLLGKKCSKSLS